MSIVKDKDSRIVTQERRQARPQVRHRVDTKTRPSITVRTHYIERKVSKPSALPGILAQAAVFATIAGVSFFASSLIGQVKVETARKELAETRVRMQETKKAEAAIRDRLIGLMREDKIEEWAISHGMSPIDGLGRTASLTTNGSTH